MTHDELKALCQQILGVYPTFSGEAKLSRGCLSLLAEVALLEEQRGGNTTPIFWELLAKQDKLKEEVEQWKTELAACGAMGEELEARLQAAREALEQAERALLSGWPHDPRPKGDNTIYELDGAICGNALNAIRRAKAVFEDKDYDN